MSKKTRLNDDATIYQARDTRTAKEIFKSMTFKQKVEHFNQYYRLKVISVITVIALVGSLIYTMFGPKVENVLYVAILDNCIDADTASEYQEVMNEKLGLDTSKYTTFFDTSFYVGDSSSYASSSIEKLGVYIATGEIDIMIGTEDFIKQYASQGYFKKLSECLPSQMFSNLTDNFFYYETEDDSQQAPYGIYLDDFALKDKDGNIISPVVLSIVANSEYTDNAVQFIETLNLE